MFSVSRISHYVVVFSSFLCTCFMCTCVFRENAALCSVFLTFRYFALYRRITSIRRERQQDSPLGRFICGWKRTGMDPSPRFDENARSAICCPSCATHGFPHFAGYALHLVWGSKNERNVYDNMKLELNYFTRHGYIVLENCNTSSPVQRKSIANTYATMESCNCWNGWWRIILSPRISNKNLKAVIYKKLVCKNEFK